MDGWHPVNIVMALSKPIDRVMMEQMIEYLIDNDLIDPNHHGNLSGKSTQTITSEIIDVMIQNMDMKMEAAIIAMDQSKAYDIVCHWLLRQKLKVVGFSNNASKLFKYYLKDIKQYSHINGTDSEVIGTKDRSVCQGSTLSGLLYLIFPLDITKVFHTKTNHNSIEDRALKHMLTIYFLYQSKMRMRILEIK